VVGVDRLEPELGEDAGDVRLDRQRGDKPGRGLELTDLRPARSVREAPKSASVRAQVFERE